MPQASSSGGRRIFLTTSERNDETGGARRTASFAEHDAARHNVLNGPESALVRVI
jgi:hypothetical protein